jgi:hypothetical protein
MRSQYVHSRRAARESDYPHDAGCDGFKSGWDADTEWDAQHTPHAYRNALGSCTLSEGKERVSRYGGTICKALQPSGDGS